MFAVEEYYEPRKLSEAILFLKDHPQVKIVAGGTDVFVKMRHQKTEKQKLLAIRNLKELKGITIEEDGSIVIGALSTFKEISGNFIVLSKIPLLAEAALSMGGPQIRNVATVGGNLCNGAVSADSASSLLALNAQLELISSKGTRMVPLLTFYKGPGKTDLSAGEILRRVWIKRESYEQMYGHYLKYGIRKAMDIAAIGTSVMLKLERGYVTKAAVAATVMAPQPIRLFSAEQELIGKKLTSETMEKASKRALQETRARDSWRASKMFREHMLEQLLMDIMEQIRRESGADAEENY